MLMRFDPFRELERELERFRVPVAGTRTPAMPMDAYRRGDTFVVHFDLPGIDPESIDLTVDKNVLTVTAERTWSREEGDDVLVAERFQGKFSRQLFLGDSLDADRIEARYADGVLTVTIPVAEAAKPRKVAISTGGEQPKVIETGSTEAA